MRRIAFALVAALIVSGTAAAAWKGYPLPQLGLALEFPGEPSIAMANYKTPLVPSAPVYSYSFKQDNALFIATIVDLMEKKDNGANILGEAQFNYETMGDVPNSSAIRVENPNVAVWGRFLTVDCRSSKIPDQPGLANTARAWFKNNTGYECPDGARLTVSMFFNKGRLYLIQGMNLPNPDDSTIGPEALRFANSVSFPSAPNGN